MVKIFFVCMQRGWRFAIAFACLSVYVYNRVLPKSNRLAVILINLLLFLSIVGSMFPAYGNECSKPDNGVYP